jgi:ribosomal protein L12E/L44/L45/RPP1/RPP2
LENMDLVPDEEGGNLFLVNGSMTPLRSAGAAYQSASGGDDSSEQDDPKKQEETEQEQEPEEDTKNTKPRKRGRRNS